MADTLYALTLYGLYPVWLAAGAVDYMCHRNSTIHKTSGRAESSLHVAQFLCMLLLVALLAWFVARGVMLWVLVALVATHTVLSYVDVRYTQPRRYISVVEQHAHGFLDVLPIVAVAVMAVADGPIAMLEGRVETRRPGLEITQLAWLLLSFVVLAGVPILEEWLRVARAAPAGPARVAKPV